MSSPIVIAGFSPSNRDPGAFGEVLYGVGGQTAASLPVVLLVVGLKGSAGTITPDVQVQKILSTADADNYAGPGSELATMLYDTLALGGNAGVPIYAASPTPAGGATAATTNIRFAGTATGSGSVTVRIGGAPVSVTVNIGDTAAVAATNLAAAVAGFNGGRLPVTATAATSYCTLACRTAGIRGMQHVVFLDTTLLPAGITATLYQTAAITTAYLVGDQVIPVVTNGFYYKATAAGTSAGTAPTWPTTIGTTVTDGSVTWTCWGTTATGNIPTTALFLGSGTGLETYVNLLATLSTKSYGRIALAANDAASLAAWKTQIDQLFAAPFNFLQNVVFATNGTMANATSVGQTTCNDPLFQGLWELNCEGHPSRMAAGFGAVRAMSEQANPNAAYNDFAITTVPAQSQQVDWPSLAVRISALNNSVSVCGSWLGDGFSRIARSITTKSLTGGNPDYSTLDTGQAIVPQFVLLDAKLYWASVLAPQNPVCQDDPPAGQRPPPSGVLTPSRAASALTARLVDFSNGILSGVSQTIPPICKAPVPGDVEGTFDASVGRIMVAENVHVMPNNAQIGVSVRQAA